MPTPTKGPRLGGGPAHERLMLANLATALFEHGRITTTEAKAKRLRPLAERLITFAKRGDLSARRRVLTVVRDKDVVHTLFAEIGPRYANRPGGYTRIIKIGPRKGDNAPMAVIELVEELTVAQTAVGEAEGATKRASRVVPPRRPRLPPLWRRRAGRRGRGRGGATPRARPPRRPRTPARRHPPRVLTRPVEVEEPSRLKRRRPTRRRTAPARRRRPRTGAPPRASRSRATPTRCCSTRRSRAGTSRPSPRSGSRPRRPPRRPVSPRPGADHDEDDSKA